MLDAFADPADFCRTCRSDKWAEDGARCDVCGGTGLRTVAVLPRPDAPLTGPQLRDWRRDNPRCACGACDGLTMVCEGYYPEPPVYRCAGCFSPSSPGPTLGARDMTIFDDIRKDRDFCGKMPRFVACDCEKDGCFHDQVNDALERRLARLDRLERIALKMEQQIWIKVGGYLAGQPHSEVSEKARRGIEAAIKAAFRAACGEGE